MVRKHLYSCLSEMSHCKSRMTSFHRNILLHQKIHSQHQGSIWGTVNVTRGNPFVTSGTYYVPLTKSLFQSAGITVSHFFSMLPSTLVCLFRWTSHNQNAVSQENAFWLVQRNRYFKVDCSMEKKWDTVIPADVKRLFVKGDTICPAGH